MNLVILAQGIRKVIILSIAIGLSAMGAIGGGFTNASRHSPMKLGPAQALFSSGVQFRCLYGLL